MIYRLIAAAIAGAIAVFAFYAFMKPESPPPSAEDQLVQNVDLTRIESFSPIDSQTLDIRDLDRIAGIVLNGRLYTFKDFSPA
ncbi:MAG: hypothetical protein NAOJABEB_00512 [Steroidobacteraceae bacterium]|nr:hypothetical protein [Steroidobacteraceae bacterium]